MSPPAPTVRCREIGEADIGAIINLLTTGFRHHGRQPAFWGHALATLSEHGGVPGFPKYGYMLESDDRPVGVLLLIFSIVGEGKDRNVRCNGSSLYVEPAFRTYAGILMSRALRHKNVNYLNISPVPHTLPMLEAQGYIKYSDGRFIAFPVFSGGPRGARVKTYTPETGCARDLTLSEIDLLAAHARFGCMSLICSAAGRPSPFVFAVWRRYGLRFAYLVYCRDLSEFVYFAGPLGRSLFRRGFPIVIVDANGPLRPLLGIYQRAEPKFFKGPNRPRLGDLAYSERSMFGV